MAIRLRASRGEKLAQTRYGELLEFVPDGLLMVDAGGSIVLANTHLETLFGYPKGELQGQPIETLLPERYRAAHAVHRAGFLARPRARSMGLGLELHGVRKNGVEFPVEISLSPLPAADGQTLVMAAIRDISERKRFESALKEKNAELERASRAKDRFLATMSHELRTPLNAVIGFTGTLLMKLPGPLTTDQERQLKTIQSSAGHLLSLINDLLDLARIEAGKLLLSPEPTRCSEVAESVADTLRPLAQVRGLTLRVAVADGEPELNVDRRALRQIVLNLVNNAIKFTEHGGITVQLGRATLEAEPAFEISVADTGAGIDAEDQLRLFSAFSRLEASGGRGVEGTGLGLYLSQKLAEALGGRIVVRSQTGAGSVFTLVLPLS